MTTLDNKHSDIITSAMGAEVNTYVTQVHVYNMICIYIYGKQENWLQGAKKSEYNLDNCKNAYGNSV